MRTNERFIMLLAGLGCFVGGMGALFFNPGPYFPIALYYLGFCYLFIVGGIILIIFALK